MGTINLVSIITIALLGSFGHCLGMCGGIVVAYSSAKIENNQSVSQRFIRHLLYSLGRVTTYVVMGVFFGFLGGVVTFGPKTYGVLYIVAGIAMIIMGFSVLGYIKALSSPAILTSSKVFLHWFRKMLQSKTIMSFYGLGVLNGFLPCGLVYFFEITAASTGHPFWGGVVMAIFGISTIPALMTFAFVMDFLKKSVLRTWFYRIAGITIILYGLYTLHTAYRFLTIPGITLHECH
jgi:uncharacterized protein